MKLNFLEKFFVKRATRKQEKQSKVSGAIVTGIPGGVVWPDRNYENFAKETYMKNLIAYRCIDYTAKSVSSVPWKLFKQIDEDTSEIVKDNPISRVLKRANPQESFMFVIYSHISYLCMAGNAYLEKVGPSEGSSKGDIKELYSLRPDRMKINVHESGAISGYTYTVSGAGVPFECDQLTGECDIMHMKLFHPLDDFYGMAPVEPGAISIDSHNSSSEWNKNLVKNEAKPGAVFMFEHALQDKQYDRLEKQIKENREGPSNVGKSLIIEGGKDVKPYGFSPSEMDWLNSNQELARNICLAWGVPPQLIGLPDTSTYSNYQEARLAFWEETVIFYLNYLKEELNFWIFSESTKEDKLFIDYLLDEIPALSVKRDKLWERAQNASFITENEKRAMVGYDEIEGGDVVLIPASMIPLGETSIDEEESITEEEMQDEEDDAVKNLVETGLSSEDAQEAVK